jgi:hypothetical protein
MVLALRPAISDLFAGHEIPPEAGSRILRDAVGRLVVHCRRLRNPRRFFLRALEAGCEAYARERETETKKESEHDDGKRPPDA